MKATQENKELACRIYYGSAAVNTVILDFIILWQQRYHSYLLEGIEDKEHYKEETAQVLESLRVLDKLFTHNWDEYFFKMFPTVNSFIKEMCEGKVI